MDDFQGILDRLNVDPQGIPDIIKREKAFIEYGLVNLSEMDLISLPSGVFDGYANISHINISNNQLDRIPSVFQGLNKLLTLDLSTSLFPTSLDPDQQLTLPSDLFDDLDNLLILDLSENQIEVLPEPIFKNLFKLEALNLTNNLLAELPNSIGNCVNLEELYLTGNLLPPEYRESYPDYNDLQDFLVPFRNNWQNINPAENIPGEIEYSGEE